MIITLDPTHADFTILELDSKVLKFPHNAHDAGAAIIRALGKLNLSEQDELQVVAGPGNFTAVRSAALIANSIAYSSGCKLSSKQKSARDFSHVECVIPFYATPPSITIAKS
ncbi:MAG: hypothetical protein ABIH35_01435 [Patescibacteria group bacterium]